ncbi:MAG: hypothetical protein K0R39_3274 [Symbiobacteriaceae bacterium]|jgi:hypothetical protein|nr:hypothetical protein [Symbiobacteriaceae bacterium]
MVGSQPDLVLIGCGGFGAQVAKCLRQRTLPDLAVETVEITGMAVNRNSGEKLLRNALEQGLSARMAEWQTGSRLPMVALVGMPDDTAGGGALVATLAYLAADSVWQKGRRVVWLAVPPTNLPERSARGRTYATLLELDKLRQEGAFEQAFLYESPPARETVAPIFSDAIQFYNRAYLMPPREQGFAGFGFAVQRDLATVLATDLTHRVIKREAERLLSERPDTTGLTAPLKEHMAVLLVDFSDDDLKGRWAEGGKFQTFEREFATDMGAEDFADYMWRQRRAVIGHYEPASGYYPFFPDTARKTWLERGKAFQATLDRVRSQCKTANSRSAWEAFIAAIQECRRELYSAIDHAANRAMRLEQDLTTTENRFRVLKEETAKRKMPLHRPRPTPEQREELKALLVEMDLIAAKQRVLGWIQDVRRTQVKALETMLSSIQTESVRAQSHDDEIKRLLEAYGTVPEDLQPAEAAHIFPAFPQVDKREALADQLAPGRLEKHLSGQNRTNSRIFEGLRDDLTRALQANPEVAALASTGQPARQGWLRYVIPQVSLADGVRPAAGFPCRIPYGSPPYLQQELKGRQLDVKLDTEILRWFKNEFYIFSFASRLGLGALPWFSEFQKAYAAGTPGLHVLTEPKEGWADALGSAGVPRAQLGSAAVTFVRSLLLGLIRQKPDGTFEARYLAEEYGETGVAIEALGALPAALGALGQDAELRQELDRTAGLWFSLLTPRHKVGYVALARWLEIKMSRLAAAEGLEAAAAVKEAAGQEAARIAAQVPDLVREVDAPTPDLVGGAADDFSLAAGGWRYIKW